MKFVDSAFGPSSLSIARAVFDRGYRAWGMYVAGAAYHIWTPAELGIVLRAGFVVLPIVVPPPDLSGRARDLVAAGIEACQDLGLTGVLAIDTENNQSDNPYLQAWVNGFENHVRQHNAWKPVVYSGAGYAGDAHDWRPAWTAAAGTIGPAPRMPGAADAIQWAGNIDRNGVLVDLSYAGADFPFARKV